MWNLYEISKIIFINPQHPHDAGSWNPSLWTTESHLSNKLNSVAAYERGKRGTMASAAAVMTLFSPNLNTTIKRYFVWLCVRKWAFTCRWLRPLRLGGFRWINSVQFQLYALYECQLSYFSTICHPFRNQQGMKMIQNVKCYDFNLFVTRCGNLMSYEKWWLSMVRLI